MKLPPFQDFLESLDMNKFRYDLSLYSPQNLKENYNPFTPEQYRLIADTNFAMIQSLLAQYHQWLREQIEK